MGLPAERAVNIVMVPDYRAANSYQARLAEPMEAQGATVTHSRKVGAVLPLLRVARHADVLHLHWVHPFIAHRRLALSIMGSLQTMVEIAALRMKGVRVVWTMHNLISHEAKHPSVERWARRWLSRLCNAVIVHSEAARATVQAAYGIEATVIPHGVDTAPLPPQQKAREALSIPDQSPIYLVFGMVRDYKRVPDILRGFRRQHNPAARLYVVGKPMTNQIHMEVDALAVQDPRVTVRWGVVSDEAMMKYASAADAFVIAHDGLTSGVAAQAAGWGKPIVDADFQPVQPPEVWPWADVARATVSVYEQCKERMRVVA